MVGLRHQTPGAMIEYLLPLIKSDSTIANYVNHQFGIKVKASRIAEIRREKSPKYLKAGMAPMSDGSEKSARAAARDGSARLLAALQKYFANRVQA